VWVASRWEREGGQAYNGCSRPLYRSLICTIPSTAEKKEKSEKKEKKAKRAADDE
jgi:hypothetical protein